MAQRSQHTRLVLLILATLVATGARSVAQTPAAPAHAAPPAADAHPGSATQPSAGQPSEETTETGPVLAVTSVEIMRSNHPPVVDVVIARGLTSSDDWSGVTLVPLTHSNTPGTTLDLVLVAQQPEQSPVPAGYAAVEAVLPLPPGHPYKEIRVRSATNAIIIREFPGYVEAPAPADPCRSCVGKHFVAKGAKPPAGVAPADLIHEETLPANVRVLRPADGVGDTRPNPNRLTLIIGDDGRIDDAVWE